MSSKKTILGFIAGAAAGVLAGILFAPDSGRNTRSRLRDNTGDWQDEADEANANDSSFKAGEERIRQVMHDAKITASL